MSDEKCYIAPARRKSATEKKTREDGGKHGHAIYTERGESLSVEVHPRQVRVSVRTENK